MVTQDNSAKKDQYEYMTVAILRADGTEETHDVKKNVRIFHEIYPLINAMTIEIVHLSPDLCMLLDEDGYANMKQVNVKASIMYWTSYPDRYPYEIVGDVAIVSKQEFNEADNID